MNNHEARRATMETVAKATCTWGPAALARPVQWLSPAPGD